MKKKIRRRWCTGIAVVLIVLLWSYAHWEQMSSPQDAAPTWLSPEQLFLVLVFIPAFVLSVCVLVYGGIPDPSPRIGNVVDRNEDEEQLHARESADSDQRIVHLSDFRSQRACDDHDCEDEQ